jgi:hypothetical protein
MIVVFTRVPTAAVAPSMNGETTAAVATPPDAASVPISAGMTAYMKDVIWSTARVAISADTEKDLTPSTTMTM